MPYSSSSWRFQRTTRSSRSSDGEAVVQRLEDVLAELAHPLELVGLGAELAIEPPVLERRRRLRRHRRRAAPCPRCSAARCSPCGRAPSPRSSLPSRRTARSNGSRLRARNRLRACRGGAAATDSSSASVWPAISRVATSEDGDSGGGRSGNPACAMVTNSPSRPTAGASISAMRSTTSVSVIAMDQPLAQPLQVEIAVEVAGEADQRAAVVVAVAVVDAVQRRLDRVLDRPRQQHDDERREQRDDRVLLLVGVAQEDAAGDPQQDRVDRGDRRRARRRRPAPRLMITSTSISR